MRKTILIKTTRILFFVVLLIGMVSAPPTAVNADASPSQPIWIAFDASGVSPSSPQIDILTESADGFTFRVTTPGAWAQADGSSARVWLDGRSAHESAGNDLPLMRWTVEVPRGHTATVETLAVQSQPLAFEAYRLPAQIAQIAPQPCKCAEGESGALAQAFIPVTGTQPTVPLTIADSYIQGGRQIATLEIRPFLLTASALLQVHLRIEGRVRFVSTSAAVGQALRASAAPSAIGLIDHLLPSRAAGLLADANDVGYVVVTPPAYLSALQPFLQLKTSQGYAVTVLTLDQTGSTPEAIRDALRSAYADASTRPAYVLLVGDVNNGDQSLPAWRGSAANHPTDLYYATLEGDDSIPDVLLGRLPMRSPAEVSTWVDGQLRLASSAEDSPRPQSASFLSTCDRTYADLVESTHSAAIDGVTRPMGYWGRFPQQPQAGGDQLFCVSRAAGYDQMLPAFSEGRDLIVYSGHGSVNNWEMGLSNFNLASSVNAEAQPVVMSFACQTAKFDAQRSFGESWLILGGAQVFIGASDDTYWLPDNRLEMVILDRLHEHPRETLAQALQAGLQTVGQEYPSFATYYREVYALLGDPSLRLPAGVPESSFQVDAPQASLTALPGTRLSLRYTLTNRLDTPEQVQVMALPGAWAVTVDALISVPARGSAEVIAVVDVPAWAASGETDSFTLEFTPYSDPQMRSHVTTTLEARRLTVMLPLVTQ